MAAKKPVGTVTRGTTNPNRLRRVDRYLCSLPVLRNVKEPIVVDLGYGASPITAVELLARCQKVNPKTKVVGVEIEQDRVARGLEVATDDLQFVRGGFETPLPSAFATGTKVDLIRAFNVLRQYSEAEVGAAWKLMQSRLSQHGFLIEGTCDEIGRLQSWVTLDSVKPLWFTVSLRLSGLENPSKVAERLPKALIHHNVEGEPIYDFLQALDLWWNTHAPLGVFGAVQRWCAVCQSMADAGWPIKIEPRRWKLGEITLDWAAVAPKTAIS
ncbi:MAG: class I SAM-dependent methyltransferase [Rhodoluna sp.]